MLQNIHTVRDVMLANNGFLIKTKYYQNNAKYDRQYGDITRIENR